MKHVMKAVTLLRHLIGSSLLQSSADDRSAEKEISFKDTLPSNNPDRSEETKELTRILHEGG